MVCARLTRLAVRYNLLGCGPAHISLCWRRGTTLPAESQGHDQAPGNLNTNSKLSLNTEFEFPFSPIVPQIFFTALEKAHDPIKVSHWRTFL